MFGLETLPLIVWKKPNELSAKNRLAVDRIVDILVDKESIDGKEFRQLLAKFSPTYKTETKTTKTTYSLIKK